MAKLALPHSPRGAWGALPAAGRTLYLGVGLQEVVEHMHRDGEVPSVEGVGAIPSLRPELASFRYHRVEVAESKEDAFELRVPGAGLQGVLREKGRFPVSSQVLLCRAGCEPAGPALLPIKLPHALVRV